LGTIQD